jgi:hypothetical protein
MGEQERELESADECCDSRLWSSHSFVPCHIVSGDDDDAANHYYRDFESYE